MLQRRDKVAVVKMTTRLHGVGYTVDQLIEEAVAYRRARGWFVWECDSTARKCRGRRFEIEMEGGPVPAFPDL